MPSIPGEQMSPAELLAARQPQAVFGTDVAAGFRALARKWHPDANKAPEAAAVMGRLLDLRRIAEGTAPAEVVPLSAGELSLVGTTWQLTSSFAAEPGLRAAASARRAHTDLARRIPEVQGTGPWTVQLPPGAVPLHRVLSARGRIEPVHVAWMVSRLLELHMELDVLAKAACGGIVPDSLVVDPKDHGLYVVDWRFTTPYGQRLRGVPTDVVGFVPADRLATAEIDRRSIQAAALRLLGDPVGNGNALVHRGVKLPEPMFSWLRTPQAGTAKDVHKRWRETLTTTFGPPTFHAFTH